MSLLTADSVTTPRSTPASPAPPVLRRLLKTIGSLWLTVAILFLLVFIMLWGTIVANKYGDTAARFGIYGSWWFNAIGFVLALNSAASLVLRWPWKRQQLGFTLPHIGLIVLLLGCLLSRRYGIDATVSIIEGQSSDRAYQGARQNVELDGAQHFKLHILPSDPDAKTVNVIDVPFTSGPFNWEDFGNGNLSLLPWAVQHQDRSVDRLLLAIERCTWNQPWYLAHRDRGVLYDRDGVRLEVIDYLSNSLPPENEEANAARPHPGPLPEGEGEPRPLPFDKDAGYRLRQAKVKLTVDGQSEVFWIPCSTYDPEEMLKLHKFSPEEIQQALKEDVLPQRFRHAVEGRGRQVVLELRPQSFQLGFAIQLDKAWQKLDPGSPDEARKSEYASEIDLLPSMSDTGNSASAARLPKFEGLRVTLNAPLDFTDPRSGKSFRMFQSTMSPAYQPQQFGIKLGEPVYVSGLSLNDDPGRGVTYVGCLLVVAGIFVAYFVRIAPARKN